MIWHEPSTLNRKRLLIDCQFDEHYDLQPSGTTARGECHSIRTNNWFVPDNMFRLVFYVLQSSFCSDLASLKQNETCKFSTGCVEWEAVEVDKIWQVNWRLAFYGRPSIWEHHGYDFPQKRPGDSIVKVLQYLRPFFCTTRCNEILRRGYWKAWTENCETTFQSSIRTEYVRSWRQHV